jgi:hypothetical protein
VKGFVDAHVTSGRRSMISREEVATKGQRSDNKHEEFLIVLNRLEYDKFAVEEGDTVLANVVAVSGMNSEYVLLGERGGGR